MRHTHAAHRADISPAGVKKISDCDTPRTLLMMFRRGCRISATHPVRFSASSTLLLGLHAQKGNWALALALQIIASCCSHRAATWASLSLGSLANHRLFPVMEDVRFLACNYYPMPSTNHRVDPALLTQVQLYILPVSLPSRRLNTTPNTTSNNQLKTKT